MKWITTRAIGWILAILIGCVTADCEEAFPCLEEYFTGLSINTKELNPMIMSAQALDGACQDIDKLMECYGSFTSCHMYTQYISLPTSVQVSRGLKMLCDYKSKIALDCPEIGQGLTWFGNKIKTKFSSGIKSMAAANYMEEAFDLVCQEKKTFARYTTDILHCKIFRSFLNTSLQGDVMDTAYDLICDNKEVFMEAQMCARNSAKRLAVTAMPESFACLATYFNSLQNPNNTSLESQCRLMSELMRCSPYLKALMMCRKGMYDLMESQGHKMPCSEIFQ